MSINPDSNEAMNQAFDSALRQYVESSYSNQQLAIQGSEGMKKVDERIATDVKQLLELVTLLYKFIEAMGATVHKAEKQPHATSKDAAVDSILTQASSTLTQAQQVASQAQSIGSQCSSALSDSV